MNTRVVWAGSIVLVAVIAVAATLLLWLALAGPAPRISEERAVELATLHAKGWGLADGEELLGLARMTYAEAKTAAGSNSVARTGECGPSYCENDVWVVTLGGTVVKYAPPTGDGIERSTTYDNMWVLVDSDTGAIYSWGSRGAGLVEITPAG